MTEYFLDKMRDIVSLVAPLPDGLGVEVLYWNANSSGSLGWFTGQETKPVVWS